MISDYKLILSKRKTISIEITHDSGIIVRAHPRLPLKYIEQFLLGKKEWIKKKQTLIASRKKNIMRINPHLVPTYKKQAFEMIQRRLNWYSTITGIAYCKLKITSARTRFGSCTSKGVLSFSWRLLFYPEEVIDYVVVHELMHLKEFNHSKRFWAEVEKLIPEYNVRRKWLRDNGSLVVFSKV